jgi:hypothetical protein
VEPPLPLENYADESDSVILEDESGRVVLSGVIDPHLLNTGV